MIYVLLLIRDAQRPSERAELWASCLCNSRPRLFCCTLADNSARLLTLSPSLSAMHWQ